MGTTLTSNYNLIKPDIYEEFDAWGGHTNADWDSVDTIMKANEDAAGAAQATADAKAPVDDATFTGTTTADEVVANSFAVDATNIWTIVGDTVTFTMDTGDFLDYDRTANQFEFYIGGAPAMAIDPVGPIANSYRIDVDTEFNKGGGFASLTFDTVDNEIFSEVGTNTIVVHVDGVDSFTFGAAENTSASVLKVPAGTDPLHAINLQQALNISFPASRLLVSVAHTLEAADLGRTLRMSSATPGIVTVPLAAFAPLLQTGHRLNIVAWGASTVALKADVGVTIRSKGAALQLADQYAGLTLEYLGAEEWYAVGDLS